MKKHEIVKLNQMRLRGEPPSVIARELGLSINTVKSYIHRHPNIGNTIKCQWCEKPVLQSAGRKEKKFCSDRCRITYWNHRYRREDHHDRNKAS